MCFKDYNSSSFMPVSEIYTNRLYQAGTSRGNFLIFSREHHYGTAKIFSYPHPHKENVLCLTPETGGNGALLYDVLNFLSLARGYEVELSQFTPEQINEINFIIDAKKSTDLYTAKVKKVSVIPEIHMDWGDRDRQGGEAAAIYDTELATKREGSEYRKLRDEYRRTGRALRARGARYYGLHDPHITREQVTKAIERVSTSWLNNGMKEKTEDYIALYRRFSRDVYPKMPDVDGYFIENEDGNAIAYALWTNDSSAYSDRSYALACMSADREISNLSSYMFFKMCEEAWSNGITELSLGGSEKGTGLIYWKLRMRPFMFEERSSAKVVFFPHGEHVRRITNFNKHFHVKEIFDNSARIPVNSLDFWGFIQEKNNQFPNFEVERYSDGVRVECEVEKGSHYSPFKP